MHDVDALIGRTAKLPQIALEAPDRAIGRNTVEALKSGIVYGFAGQVEAIVARIRAEIGVRAKVVATGGLGDVVAKQTPVIDAVEALMRDASARGLGDFDLSAVAQR